MRLPILEGLTPEQRRRVRMLEGLGADGVIVHEIYASIQGESTYAGLPCTFVRLTACHLRCRWCDSPHAFSQGTWMPLDAVIAQVETLSPILVEVTGGEPLLQPGVYPLLTQLCDRGKRVLLETSGSLSIADVDPRVVIVLDIKCPGSGEVEANQFENLARLKPRDEVKFVIADRRDFDWMLEQIAVHELGRRTVLCAPVFGELDPAMLCQWILESRLPLRYQPQLHKQIWDPKARGV